MARAKKAHTSCISEDECMPGESQDPKYMSDTVPLALMCVNQMLVPNHSIRSSTECGVGSSCYAHYVPHERAHAPCCSTHLLFYDAILVLMRG